MKKITGIKKGDLRLRARDSNGKLVPMLMPTCPEIGYTGIHVWVKKRLGQPMKCSFDPTHKAKRFEWASVSGKCLLDLSDYMSLCPSCHRKYDFKEETRRKLIRSHLGNHSKPKRKVSQFSKDGRLVKTFSGVIDASIESGVCRTGIENNLSGRSKSAGGYVWKSLDENKT